MLYQSDGGESKKTTQSNSAISLFQKVKIDDEQSQLSNLNSDQAQKASTDKKAKKKAPAKPAKILDEEPVEDVPSFQIIRSSKTF